MDNLPGMKSPLLPYRAGWLLGALLVSAAPLPAASPRETFLTAKQTATDANYRNDKAGLDAALARFAALSADPELGPRAAYHAAWTEWMLAASYFQDQQPAEAGKVLESGVTRLRIILDRNPADAEAHGLLGWMLMALGASNPARFPELAPQARDHRQRALELAPASPRIVMLEATMLCYAPKPELKERGFARWQDTLRLLDEEKSADPTLPDWGRTLADGWLANLLLTLDPTRKAEARAHAEKALRERPDFWWVKTQVLPQTTPQP